MPQYVKAVAIVLAIVAGSARSVLLFANSAQITEDIYEKRSKEIHAWRQSLPAAMQRYVVTYCVDKMCHNITPGQSFWIPKSFDIRSGHTWVRRGMSQNADLKPQLWHAPPHKKYCMSAYIDAVTGRACNCLAEKCYSHISATSSQVANCVHRVCHPRISGEEPLFCSAMLPRTQVKFVPITFRGQSYFTPGIRVLFTQEVEDAKKARTLPMAKNIYLDYGAGQVRKVEHFYINGDIYEIVVERQEGQDLICGTYMSMGKSVVSSCVPTPSLRIPRVYHSPHDPRTITAVFHGCSKVQDCTFRLRVGEESTRFVGLQAVIPSFNHEYSMKQYAVCPQHSHIDQPTVDAMRKGTVLCQDGTRGKIKYMTGSSNLICLHLKHRFFPEMIVDKNVELFLRQEDASSGTTTGVHAIQCDVCGEHLAESHVLFRDNRGRLDTARYSELAMESINAANDNSGNTMHRAPEVLGALIHKKVQMLDSDRRRLISDPCAGISDISLHEQQILLDKIQHVGLGVVFISSDDMRKYSSKNLAGSTCSDQEKVMFRYSEAFDDDLREKLQTESLAEAQDQGLCVVASNAILRATPDVYTYRGKPNKHNSKQYSYTKRGLFVGCDLFKVEIIGATSGIVIEAIFKNNRRSKGVDIAFLLGKGSNDPSGVTICPGGTETNENTDSVAQGCVGVIEEYGSGILNHSKGMIASPIELISMGNVQKLYGRPSPEGEVVVTCIQ
ncbi:hypothetical protein [Candidatus Anaplasma sp. TIGMIC]|uniref:hypothetical protein n=1 Tax=Candidatus Anaplasma sp. TIGMIC TaxID=3020713 RepID=UPI00232E54C3|nr:hypothetical protein [Candidatus Anaplasma sp. TIGMIC]MDB1135743.1 hypothetical protein [Candidatus Anaplasma sp. TIGMIC]